MTATATGTIRIAMWSGPRNISTAMMRSWEARGDCTVKDEPFYGPFLVDTGRDHPMRDEILADVDTDWDSCARACEGGDTPLVYQKHMCQHMVDGVPLDWMQGCRHAFLIRPPEEVAASFTAKWDGAEAEDIGFRRQAELFDHVCDLTGAIPPVIEARTVLSNPGAALSALCTALDVPYTPRMLGWPAGRRESDGIWGRHWYNAVEQSTGFAPPRDPSPVNPDLQPMIDECRPYYERLAVHRLSPAG